jgi:hypothetical protein
MNRIDSLNSEDSFEIENCILGFVIWKLGFTQIHSGKENTNKSISLWQISYEVAKSGSHRCPGRHRYQ